MSSKPLVCGCVSGLCPLCKRLELLGDAGGSDLGFVSENLCPELCRLFWYTARCGGFTYRTGGSAGVGWRTAGGGDPGEDFGA